MAFIALPQTIHSLFQGGMRQVASISAALRLILSVPVFHSSVNQATKGTCISYLKTFLNQEVQKHSIL